MKKKCFIVFSLIVLCLLVSSCASLGHKHQKFYYEVIKEPTCAAKGERKVFCLDCGKLVRIEQTDNSDVHWFGYVKSLKAPTCTEPGLGRRSCENCGYTIEEEIPANGHSYSDVAVEWGGWGEEDKYYKVCVVCGDRVPISNSEAKTRLDKLGKTL